MIPLDRIQPLDTFLSDSLAPPGFRAVIVPGLALVGLALGALGVAAPTVQSVGERTGELGVRLVLWAEQRSLRRSAVLRQIAPTGCGLALGLALSLGAARLLACRSCRGPKGSTSGSRSRRLRFSRARRWPPRRSPLPGCSASIRRGCSCADPADSAWASPSPCPARFRSRPVGARK
jgi:hypothetical protein